MSFYYFISLSIMIFGSVSLYSNASKNFILKFLFFYFLLFLCFIIGFRGDIEPDYINYISMYELSPVLNKGFSFSMYNGIHGEYLYLFIGSLYKTLGLEFNYYLMTISFLSVFILYYYINKFSMNGISVICLYFSFSFFLVEFIQVRWAISCSLILLGLYLASVRFYIRAAVMIFVAGFFQSLAFIFLPLVFFNIIKYSSLSRVKGLMNFFVIVFPFVIFICSKFYNESSIFKLLFYVVPSVESIITSSKYYQAGGISLSLEIFYLLEYIVILFLYFLYIKVNCSKLKQVDFLFFSYFYSVSIQLFFSFSYVVSERIYGVSFLLFSILLVDSCKYLNLNFSNRMFILFLYFLFLIMNFYITYNIVFVPGLLKEYKIFVL